MIGFLLGTLIESRKEIEHLSSVIGSLPYSMQAPALLQSHGGGIGVTSDGRQLVVSSGDLPQAPPKNRQALLTAILADGINLGLTRMSEACRETTWRQLSWTADWHVREECHAQALAGLIDAHHRQP